MKGKCPDDFEFELHMEMNNKKPKKKLDDTLDFYKENLPLNATQKLFNENKNTQPQSFETSHSSSYNNFIYKYNQDDDEKNLYSNKKESNLKKHVRSDAENEFLNDFDDKHEAFNYDYSRPKNSFGGIFIASLFVIFLCVIAALIFKINSLNAQLADIKLQINENAEAKEKLQTILIENENMKKMIEDFNNTQDNKTESVPELPKQIESKTEIFTSDTVHDTQYIVQSGDTLSSISKKFYGSPNLYNKIIEKNNLTTENLNQNQKLIIPPK